MQARTRALAFSKLTALLFKASIVSEELLHKWLQDILANASNVRVEAAAELLYQTETYMSQHLEPTSVSDMDVFYHQLLHYCRAGSQVLDAGVATDVMVSLTCGLSP